MSSDKIYNVKTRRYIKATTAFKNYPRKDLNDTTKFDFGQNIFILENNIPKLTTVKEVESKLKNNTINLQNIYGNYLVNNIIKNKNTNNVQNTFFKQIPISKPRLISESTKRNAASDAQINYTLTKEDKKNAMFMYDFIKKNNLSGKQYQLFFIQNNNIIFSQELDLSSGLSKWWKQGGAWYGQITSDSWAWSVHTNLVGSGLSLNMIGPRRNKLEEMNEFIFNFSDNPELIRRLLNEHTKLVLIPIKRYNKNIHSNNVIIQTFKNNDDGRCFFYAAFQYLKNKDDKLKNGLSKDDRAIKNKLTKIQNKYENGVTIEDIQAIADLCNINIEITNPLNENYKNIYSSYKKARFTIKLINNNINHLSCNDYLDNSQNIVEVDQEKMLEIFLEKTEEINDSNHIFFSGTLDNIQSLSTRKCTYKLVCKQNAEISNFMKENSINDFSFDILKNQTKFEFIERGVNFNAHSIINEDKYCDNNKDYCEYDMVKAYTQHKTNKYYIGFPTHLVDITEVDNNHDIKNYLGYYLVTIINFNNTNTKQILNKMGICENIEYVFTSIMLLHLKDWGCTYNLQMGCYSFTSIDLNLDKLKTKYKDHNGKKISTYAKFVGMLNCVSYNRQLNTLCNTQTAELLAQQYDNVYTSKYYNIKYKSDVRKIDLFDDSRDILQVSVKFPKKAVWYNGAIAGFFTDYCRTSVIDRMLKYQFNNIIGFKLDGFIVKNNNEKINILIKDDTPEHHLENCIQDENSIWTLKPVKYGFGWSKNIFEDNIVFPEEFNSINTYKHQFSLVTGCGGAGKTTNIFDEKYGEGKDALFVSGNWKLITEKMNEYNIPGCTIQKLIGEQCNPYYKEHKQPGIIIYDECNTYSQKWIQKAFKIYKHSQHILLGDFENYNNNLIYYQCSMKDVSVIDLQFIKNNNIQIKHNSNNYRCKDPQLLDLLNELRDKLRENIQENNLRNNTYRNIIKKHCKNIIKLEDINKYYDTTKDYILCSTINDNVYNKSQVNLITEKLGDNCNKHRCVSHTANEVHKKLYTNQKCFLRGEIINTQTPDKKFKKQEAFTIHSFQGITIKSPQKLFFSCNRIFDERQYYTALSRVEYLDQIYIIDDV